MVHNSVNDMALCISLCTSVAVREQLACRKQFINLMSNDKDVDNERQMSESYTCTVHRLTKVEPAGRSYGESPWDSWHRIPYESLPCDVEVYSDE